MSGFDPVITALLSADNAQRNAAEQYYNQCVASDANAAMMELFRVLCTSATDGARQLAAVLLRSLFKPGADSTFAKLSIEMVTGAKHTVLQSLASETNRSVRTKIVHVVAVLAARTCGAPAHAAAPAAAWPELMPFVLQMVATPDAAQRTCAFTLLGQLSDFAGSLLLSDVPSVSRTFVAGLADAALPVRVAALISTCDFLIAQCMQDGDAVDASSCPTEQMLAVVGAALSAGEESLACDAMQALVSLAEFGAALLANGIGAIGAAMLSVASTASLEAATRKLGLELIVALSEALPARVRKSPPFVAAIVEMTIKLMCEVEDGDWNAEVHSAMATEDEDQDSAWIVAAESLYRLADALGKPVLGPAFAKLEALLGSARWQERWCGIRALDTLTEAQPKAMNRQLRTIVTAALRLCADPHQRVRYEALTCLARLPEHFPGKFQKVYGTTVLPVLINAIGDPATSGNRPRVRGCAVASVVQFCNPESCPSAIVKPSADALMGALATLLGGASTVAVQEEGLSAVAAMSGVLEEDFARYYTSFFPSILAILAAPAVAGRLVLRARAMQCVGIIASTVGAERFGPDATRVMETLMRTMAGGMAAEDPGVGMLLEACTRIASCIGAAFLPYMETVLTPILAMAAADVGFKVTDVDEGPLGQGGAEEADTASGFSSVVLDVRGMGKKQLTMNTFVIEQKVLACNMILEFAKSLEKDFVGFVERTATVVLPLVKFKYFEGVRSAAAFPLPKLLDSIVKSARASTAPAERAQMLAFGKGFLSACVASLQEQLQQEKAWECRACLVEAMKELFEVCFRSGGGERDRELAPIITLDVAASTTVVQFLCELGKQSYTRQLEMIGKVRNHPDYDEEMEEDLDESLGLEAELMSEVVDALGYITKSHRAAFLPVFQSVISPFFMALLAPTNPVSLRVNALCSFIDAIEFCGPQAGVLVAPILPSMIAGCTDPDEGIRQCSTYGIGQIAKHQSALLAPRCAEVMQRLMSVVNAADARSEDNLEATENAVGAIGRIAIHMEASVDAAALLPFWLSQLPIRGDKVEACEVHETLCSLLETPARSAQLAPHMAHVVKVFGACLAGDEDEDGDVEQLAFEATKLRIAHLVRQMNASLPPAVMQQASVGMAPRESAALAAAIASQ